MKGGGRYAVRLVATVAGLWMSCIATMASAFVQMPCVNLGNALDAPVEGAWGPPITEADLDWLAGTGFRSLRLPVRFDAGWQGRIAPALLARVDEVLAQAWARGFQVILDLHHFDRLMEDPDAHADKFVAIWAELAAHFEGHDEMLVFELLNEPRAALSTARALELFDRVIPTIRARHPDRWIIIGGGEMNSLNEMLTLPTPGRRIALTFHYYDPFHFTHQLADWLDDDLPATDWGSPDEVAQVWRDMARAARPDAPVFLGEFGATEDAPSAPRAAWVDTVRRAAEAHGLGWCYWAHRAGFGIIDPATNDWRPGMREALIAP